ncbi:MAG: 16S rRNA processing protein RimM [Firmicutes bacterium]|nr:16S rRNA processing protein RimM [Bacillota bacterium]
MDVLNLGKITGAVGLKGEVKIYPYTDRKEDFGVISYVLMNGKRVEVEGCRIQQPKGTIILKLAGINDRTAAENCRDAELTIRREDAPPLPEGVYYVKDLLGFALTDEQGSVVGKLKNVLLNAAQDLYEVEPAEGGKTFLIPVVDRYVGDVDLTAKVIHVRNVEDLRSL